MLSKFQGDVSSNGVDNIINRLKMKKSLFFFNTGKPLNYLKSKHGFIINNALQLYIYRILNATRIHKLTISLCCRLMPCEQASRLANINSPLCTLFSGA